MDSEPTSTEALVQAAARRERWALEALLVRQLPGLGAWLRLRMGPALRARESEEDLVQSVCREVLADLDGFEFRGDAAFRHWLYTRAQHKLLQHVRHTSAARRDPARETHLDPARSSMLLAAYGAAPTPSGEAAAHEAVARIEAAVDALPEDWREALLLHRLVGLSHAEIGARLGRSEGAARNLVYRALARLTLALDDGQQLTAP